MILVLFITLCLFCLCKTSLFQSPKILLEPLKPKILWSFGFLCKSLKWLPIQKASYQIPPNTFLFHSHCLLVVSWKIPCTLSPQGLCTCWFLCLEYFQVFVWFILLLLSNLYSNVTLSVRHFLSSLGKNNSLYFQPAP